MQTKKYYGIKNKFGQCIGLDEASGGYPWIPDLPSQVQWWSSKERRNAYLAIFNNAEYYPVTLTMLVEDE